MSKKFAGMKFGFFGFSACLLLWFTTGASDQLSPAEELFRKYKQALTELEESYARCQGEGVFIRFVVDKDGKRTESRSQVSFAFSPGKGRETMSPLNGKEMVDNPELTEKQPAISYEKIIGFNEAYSFNLSRETPDSPPVIEAIKDGEANGRSQILNSTGYLTLGPIISHNQVMSRFLESPDFRLDSVEEFKDKNGSRRVRFAFTRPRQAGLPQNARPVTNGWFVVAPDDDWSIVEYGNVHSSQDPKSDVEAFTVVGTIRYAPNDEGMQAPIYAESRTYQGGLHLSFRDARPAPQAIAGEDFDFTRFAFTEAPASTFMLSGYGLPEYTSPVSQALARRSVLWWTIAAAVVSGLAALGLRRLARRKTTKVELPVV